MRVDTNMAWPDDPYGTGQLRRKEPWLLAGFAIRFLAQDQQTYPVSYAVVYLRLHRAQAIDLTSGVSFGFRTVAIDAHAEMGQMLRIFDLDAMRARRLAKVVAGWRLADDLAVMHAHAGREADRGIQALTESWIDRIHSSSTLAQMFDIACDPAELTDDLAMVATKSRIDISAVRAVCESPGHRNISSAAWSTIRALIYGLIAGRVLNRLSWHDELDVGAAIEANAGDCLAAQDFGHRGQPT
jgi:hypothetical protein